VHPSADYAGYAGRLAIAPSSVDRASGPGYRHDNHPRTSEIVMTLNPSRVIGAALLSAMIVAIGPTPASSQEVGLAVVDMKDVAKGYKAGDLKLRPVVNDRREKIGWIDDFIIGRENNVFAVLQVGRFIGSSGHLVAIPFRSLVLDDPGGNVILPKASRDALEKLPVFFHGG
jgi:hypothetical protein